MNDSTERSNILIAAGGTGGHIFPALAVWETLSERRSDLELTWLGSSDRIESKLIPEKGIEFIPLKATGFRRKPTPANIAYNFRSIWFLISAIFRSIGVINKFKPIIVLTTGGFAAGAVGLAAILTRTPLVIIEPNALPGMTNRFLGKYAKLVCVAYTKAKSHFPSNKTKLTGVPARKEIAGKNREESRRELGIDNETLFVLALGGSQGALGINRNLPESVKLISTDRPDLRIKVVHQYGTGKENTVAVLKEPLPEDIYKLVPFIEDVPTWLAASDIVITRAGASTLSEIACRGIPAIIIPFPHSAENHQVENAKSWESAGAAFCIEEKDLTPASLATAMLLLLSDPKKRESMGREALKFGDPDATNRIAGFIESLISN